MHSDGNGHEEMSDVDSQANVSTIQSLRALFGLIGDGYFRWLDSETRDIYEYAIRGVLKETFLTEYYANASKELEFLTYGGSQHEAQITTKHERCFGLSLHAQLMEFDYDFVRSICLKPEFKYTLKRIVYLPRGRADYGTVEKAFMQSKYRNVIDPDAERVKDILEDPDVLIDEFTARLVISTSETRSSITIRFDFTKRGRITLYLPEIEFWKQMSQIEFENRFYDIVRMAYFRITGLDISAMPAQRSEMEVYEQPYLDLDQAFDDFLEDG
jgi:hypothetical protein